MMPEEKELMVLKVVILVKIELHSLITGFESVTCDVPLPQQPDKIYSVT